MIERVIESAPWMLVPLTAIVSATLIAMVWIVSHYLYYARQASIEARLKHDMLERDLSVEEIERVLWVSGENQPAGQTSEEAPGPVSNNQLALVERLLEEGHDLEAIERLMRSLREGESKLGITDSARSGS